ncbi:killer cell lectin-like receptor 2 [Sorex fumeus]|uniref:killer cell lectin-like receptor 2 n=1 Tax=Sorex fumeus TaxID=62283 RepID=UPI0024AC9834|nr:killer cell lectin-like receptor 2 [Sorex fumeus]
MSEQEVIYSTLRFLQSPSESQNRPKADSVQRSKNTDNKGFSLPWHLLAASLGILCLLLLVTVIVLGLKVFQHVQERHQLEEILQSLSIKCDMIKNDSYVKEQLLTNKTLEYDLLKNETLQQKKELNSGKYNYIHEKNICQRKNISMTSQNKDKPRNEFWSCCGEKCYYFSKEREKWRRCEEICRKYNSFPLKIAGEDELRFIQAQVFTEYYWIGLTYDDRKNKWKWFDNTDYSGIDSDGKTSLPSGGKCACVTATRLETMDCFSSYNCVCEKRITFHPHW